MRRAVEQVLVRPERILRAVAVMHVEIDHGHALGAVLCAGVLGGDGHVVEQAEAHGARRLGMVPRGTHGAEGVVGGARHDLVDGVDRGAGGAQRRIPALGATSRCRDRARRDLACGLAARIAST